MIDKIRLSKHWRIITLLILALIFFIIYSILAFYSPTAFNSPDEKVIAMIDGQDDYEMHEGDVLIIKGAAEGAKLLHREERNYFSVLREKLKWGDEN